VLSFASEKGQEGMPIPAQYKVRAEPGPEPLFASKVEQGAAVFRKYGCAACHGPQGRGGIFNKNMDQGEEVPSLLTVADGYSREELKEIIRDGRYPGRSDRHDLSPPLWMPPWKEKLSEEELDALVEYLTSLHPDGSPQPEQPSHSAT
jgi:mono/diheme cytochrome c family protein